MWFQHEERVDSLQALNAAIRRFEDILGNQAEERVKAQRSDASPADIEEARLIWYRGQADGSLPLVPSLLRVPHALEQEQKIFLEYRRLDINAQRARDDFSILFKMQHYDVPTRLLDWTELRLFALFLALRDEHGADPAIFLLCPYLLHAEAPAPWPADECTDPARSTSSTATPETRPPWPAGPVDIRDVCPTYLRFLKEVNQKTACLKEVDAQTACRWQWPLAIRPDLEYPRMVAQRGCFTLHGRDRRPLEEQASGCVARVSLAPAAVKETVEAMGWDREQLDSFFPDDPGRALHIKKKFALDRPERSLKSCLRSRWKKDLEALRSSSGPESEDLLFAGLQGCVLMDGKYMDPKHKDPKRTLAAWLSATFPAESRSGDKQAADQQAAHSRPQPPRCCFVLAGAGAGKTNYILSAVDELHRKDSASAPAVLWCALGQLHRNEDIFDVLARHLDRLLPLRVTPDTVRALCRTEPTLLVLDGLDELARTLGGREAIRIIDRAKRELDDGRRLSVVFGCRDHIYDHTLKSSAKKLGQVHIVRLKGVRKTDVSRELGVAVNSGACKAAASAPLFLAAARRLLLRGAALKGVKTPADFRDLMVREATKDRARGAADGLSEDTASNGADSELRALGEVAALMIEKRRDFLSSNDLREHTSEGRTIARHSDPKRSRWPLFVNESEEQRFVHQSIREYLLGKGVFEGLQESNSDEKAWLVGRASSLDYESGEVYSFVADLLDERKDAFLELATSYVSRTEHGPAAWNLMMRNLFEAVGMVGDACCEDTRNATLRAACDVLGHEGKGRGARPYANFMTRFNAARCISRLHGSAPRSICRFWTRAARSGREFLNFHTHAVRGFQRRHLAVGVTSWSLFAVNERGALLEGTELLADQIVKVLAKQLDDLLCLPELDRKQKFLAANLSLAAIRWLPRGDSWKKHWKGRVLAWHKNAQGKGHPRAVPLSKAVVANLELALHYRDEPGWATEEVEKRVVHVRAISDARLILQRRLEKKFGALPENVKTRLQGATPEQLTRWAKQVQTADSPGAVLGE
ncbi:MAG: FRG domain-containing protein [Polyangiaceae bacterium]|nr:FRG domain-containing protein [Polyangiaceae bacterium]